MLKSKYDTSTIAVNLEFDFTERVFTLHFFSFGDIKDKENVKKIITLYFEQFPGEEEEALSLMSLWMCFYLQRENNIKLCVLYVTSTWNYIGYE